MGAAVEDVHERDGEDIRLLGAGQIGDVCIEGHSLYIVSPS
jgi:hypothetical protein